jgi:uncharacterized membrane protein YagU involved in acid resistance
MMNSVLVGAAAGTLATVPMTIFWETLHERLPGEPPRPLPPREVAEVIAVKAGVSRQLTETQVQWLALALHFGYGAFTGAIFGTIAPRRVSTGIGAGMLFGLGVWTTSYLGWLPATGVRHSPKYDVPARTALILASHVVWGAAAGLLLGTRRAR